jgi:fatty acid synthase
MFFYILHQMNAINSLINFEGVKDVNTVNMDVSLGDLGLDSLMNVEIKQTLQREYDSVLSTAEIRQLTIRKLQELSNNGGCQQQEPTTAMSYRFQLNKMMPDESIVCLQKKNSDMTLFMVHPLEGNNGLCI